MGNVQIDFQVLQAITGGMPFRVVRVVDGVAVVEPMGDSHSYPLDAFVNAVTEAYGHAQADMLRGRSDGDDVDGASSDATDRFMSASVESDGLTHLALSNKTDVTLCGKSTRAVADKWDTLTCPACRAIYHPQYRDEADGQVKEVNQRVKMLDDMLRGRFDGDGIIPIDLIEQVIDAMDASSTRLKLIRTVKYLLMLMTHVENLVGAPPLDASNIDSEELQDKLARIRRWLSFADGWHRAGNDVDGVNFYDGV